MPRSSPSPIAFPHYWPPDKSNAALSHASEPFVQLVMVSVHDVIGPLRLQRRQPNIDSGTGKFHAPRQRSRAAWNSEHLLDIGQRVNGSFVLRGRVLPPLEWVLLRSWLRQVPTSLRAVQVCAIGLSQENTETQ